MVDAYCEVNGHRPISLDDLYLWVLDADDALADDARAADRADWMSYFEVEPHSLLAIVNVAADRLSVARRLLARRKAVVIGAVGK